MRSNNLFEDAGVTRADGITWVLITLLAITILLLVVGYSEPVQVAP